MKRTFDIAVILIAVPILVPLMALVYLLVRFKLGAPVFFTQVRPGLHGKPFKLIKFRSMTDQRDNQGRLLSDEIRLTPFGKFLRATSLDELPEFWNVLKGEMSLVGPRPLLMEYLERYTREQARRHDVSPGLTGWAQVNGRNASSWEDRFAHDVWYVDHQNFWLDLKILGLTLWKTIKREGISAENHVTKSPFLGSQQSKGNQPY